MVLYKDGQTISGKAITSNFRGQYNSNFIGNTIFFHTGNSTGILTVGPERKRIVCIRNILWGQKIAEYIRAECA